MVRAGDEWGIAAADISTGRFELVARTLFGQARSFDAASLAAAVAYIQATDASLGEALGQRLKVLNIVIAPLAFAGIAMLMARWRYTASLEFLGGLRANRWSGAYARITVPAAASFASTVISTPAKKKAVAKKKSAGASKKKAAAKKPAAKKAAKKPAAKTPAKAKPARAIPSLEPGDRVVHDSFGMGTVVAVDGVAEKSVASIDFGSEGVKRLLLRYAPVEKL